MDIKQGLFSVISCYYKIVTKGFNLTCCLSPDLLIVGT